MTTVPSTSRRPLQLVVLISGGGTTLRNLIERVADGRLHAKILRVLSSTAGAKGLEFARAAGISTVVVEHKNFATVEAFSAAVFDACREVQPDLVVMGGFLKLLKIPADFTGRVLNIHPALIPKFCGPGFYGRRVHEAVLHAGEKTSGCTVHFVDDQYDHGPIVLQRTVPVLPGDTPETLAERVFAAECEAYPEALRIIAEKKTDAGRTPSVPPLP